MTKRSFFYLRSFSFCFNRTNGRGNLVLLAARAGGRAGAFGPGLLGRRRRAAKRPTRPGGPACAAAWAAKRPERRRPAARARRRTRARGRGAARREGATRVRGGGGGAPAATFTGDGAATGRPETKDRRTAPVHG
jgi:hypothetical protein